MSDHVEETVALTFTIEADVGLCLALETEVELDENVGCDVLFVTYVNAEVST